MKLSIVVPCYNEGANVPALIGAYAEIITRPDIEVLLINNGSTDDTGNVLAELALIHSRFLRIVTVKTNQGYGFGVLSGLKEAHGEFIGWTHGDMQTPPRDVVRALEIIEKNNHDIKIYLKGTRTGRPLFDKFFTWGMSVFETIYLRTWLYDINAQPNIFHRDFLSTWENPPYDFSLDLYALYMAKKHRLNVIRFSVPFLNRIHGESSWNTSFKSKWKFIKRTIAFSVELKQRL